MPTTLLTGANRGIGLALAQQLIARGHQVIAVVRTASPELEALDLRIERDIDLADDQLGDLAARLGPTRLDLLLHNAGVLTPDPLSPLDLAAIRYQLEINTLAPLKLTAALLDHLNPGARIACVTSRMGSIADNTSGGYYGYRISKAALNMAAANLAHDLRPKGIAVGLIHPGYVRTAMTGNRGHIDPAESAAGILARIDQLTLATSGTFWHATTGETLPW